jgi:hypothetical protein
MARALPYLVLLQVGFTLPSRVTTDAVRSYRTLSPLPAGCSRMHGIRTCGSNRHRRSALCCTFRRLTPPRCYLAPCPVEPGLSSAIFAAVAWPTPARIVRQIRRLLRGNRRFACIAQVQCVELPATAPGDARCQSRGLGRRKFVRQDLEHPGGIGIVGRLL